MLVWFCERSVGTSVYLACVFCQFCHLEFYGLENKELCFSLRFGVLLHLVPGQRLGEVVGEPWRRMPAHDGVAGRSRHNLLLPSRQVLLIVVPKVEPAIATPVVSCSGPAGR